MADGTQAGYAVVAAAFITGLWALIAQRVKSNEENTKEEIELGVTDRRNLLQNYREFNVQLQNRIGILNEEVRKLWDSITSIQKLLEESEKLRIESYQHIVELEAKVVTMTKDIEECKNDKGDLERENSRLYRLLSGRE